MHVLFVARESVMTAHTYERGKWASPLKGGLTITEFVSIFNQFHHDWERA